MSGTLSESKCEYYEDKYVIFVDARSRSTMSRKLRRFCMFLTFNHNAEKIIVLFLLRSYL